MGPVREMSDLKCLHYDYLTGIYCGQIHYELKHVFMVRLKQLQYIGMN